jgi:hypothetical protein
LAPVELIPWPILAAIRENSDFGVARGRLPFVYGAESRRRDSAGDFEEREAMEETAAWNSAVRSTAIPQTLPRKWGKGKRYCTSSVPYPFCVVARLRAFGLSRRLGAVVRVLSKNRCCS